MTVSPHLMTLKPFFLSVLVAVPGQTTVLAQFIIKHKWLFAKANLFFSVHIASVSKVLFYSSFNQDAIFSHVKQTRTYTQTRARHIVGA